MPKKTIWIRVEDVERFNEVYSPEWLHAHLNIPVVNQIVQPILASPDPEKVRQKVALAAGLCEHYQQKGKCLVKSCKYA